MSILSSLGTFFTKLKWSPLTPPMLDQEGTYLLIHRNHYNAMKLNEGLSMSRNVILSALRQEARDLQMDISATKLAKGNWWEKATPDTEQGRIAFTAYSHCRSELKRLRNRLAKVNAAIKAVKKSSF